MSVSLSEIAGAVQVRLASALDVTVAPAIRPPETGDVLLWDMDLQRDAVMSGALYGHWRGTLRLQAIALELADSLAIIDQALAELTPAWTEADVGGCATGAAQVSTQNEAPSEGRPDAARAVVCVLPIQFTEA